MKRFFRVLIILIIISITGCWDSWYDHHLIIGVDLKPATTHYAGGFNNYIETDTFKTDIVFIMTRNTKIVAQNLNNFSLIQECKATTRGLKWDNELQQDSYELFFDKYIVLNNDTIKSSVNLLKSNIIRNEISIIYEYNNSRGFDDIIVFDNNLINNLKFESKSFKAFFKCKTSDNKEFIDSTNVIIK